MDYFAGLDISMDETHVCVLDREGEVVRESKTVSTAQAIADELVKAPGCRRIVFETGRMAPILFHGLRELGFPGVCDAMCQPQLEECACAVDGRGGDGSGFCLCR
jgi:transposase